MPIPPPPDAANSITVTALDLITAALQEIGAIAPGEQPSSGDSGWTLQKLQRLIDRYNARLPMIYNVSFKQFTLQVNHTPHTIGPGGDFDAIQRPVDIPSIGLVMTQDTNTPYVEVPLTRRDQDWWAAQTIKGLSSTLPTDYYYSPSWPLGHIYFWPVPTSVNDVYLQMRDVLTEIRSYDQSFSMPPGYWDAIVYPLAVSLCPSYSTAATPDLLRLEAKAIKAIQVNNMASPRLASDAPSQPGTSRARPDFNFLNGLCR